MNYGATSAHTGHDEAAAYLELYRLSPEGLDRIREFGKTASSRIGEIIEKWYTWVETQPQYEQFFSEPGTVERVKRLQTGYWEE